MQFTAQELGLCNYVLRWKDNAGAQDSPRQLELDEQETGVAIFNKLKASIVENKFVDGEVDFSTIEKAFLLKFLERKLGVEESAITLPLRIKLS